MHRSLMTRVGLVVVVGFLLGALPALAEDECRAEIDATLRHTDEGRSDHKFKFAVDVKAHGEACAWVDYELVTTQETVDGKRKVYTVPKRIKLRGETKSRLDTYTMRASNQMLNWEFKVVKCTTCNP